MPSSIMPAQVQVLCAINNIVSMYPSIICLVLPILVPIFQKINAIDL